MSLTLTNTTLSTTSDKTEVEANFADVASKFDGNIVNSDISSSAEIDIDKLDKQYEKICLTSTIYGGLASLASGWPGSGVVLTVPIPGDNGDDAWELQDVSWVCTDTGAGTSGFSVQHGAYSSVGVWSGTNIVTGLTISSNGGSAAAYQGRSVGNSTGVSPGAAAGDQVSIAIIGTTADSTTLNANTDTITFSFLLSRKIQAA